MMIGLTRGSVMASLIAGAFAFLPQVALAVSPPTITKSFGAASILLNGTTSLSFTIHNPNTLSLLLDVAFTDSLPSGLVVATPNGLTGTCHGGTITATAGSSSVSLGGATFPANASCTFSVDVTGTSGGVKNNSVTVSSSSGGTGNTATDSVTVVSPPSITKSFSPGVVPLNGTGPLQFHINNPNSGTSLTGVGFTDNLPIGLVVATPNGLTGSCGGGTITATAGSSSVSLSGATLASSAQCSFGLQVTGTSAGQKNNSVTVNSTNGGTGNTANAFLAVVAPPSIIKSFGAANLPLNGNTSLSFTINNPNPIDGTPALIGVAFTDNLPSGLLVATPNGLTGSCGGGTITATAGSSSVSLSGATLTSAATCSFSLSVTGTSAGLKNNSVTITSTNGGTGNTANASLTVVAPPSISKSFGAASFPLNGTTSLSFTINNPNTANTLTGVAFTDNLPSGLLVATPNGLTGPCGGGTITATAGSSTVSLSGATLAASSSCTFSVDITGTSSGAKNNNVTVSSTNGGTGNTTGASVLVALPPVITKSFPAGSSIPLNFTAAILGFTINNPNTATALSGVGFTDTLPTGLVVSPNNLTTACFGGTFTATAGSNSVSLSGATLASSQQCTFGLQVTGTTAGVKNNSVTVNSTNGGTGNTANASLTVVAPPSISKSFGAASIPLNGTTSLSFTIDNPNAASSLTGVAFTENLPTGLVVNTPNGLTGSCGGGTITATAGASSVSLSGASLTASSSCTFSLNVHGTTGGTKHNSVTVSSTNGGTGNTASADLLVVSPPTITKSFGSASIQLNAVTSLHFSISNPNGTTALSGVAFTDNLPSGLLVATPNGLTGSCGGGTIAATAGASSVSLSGATLAGGCNFTLNVTGTTAGVKNNSVTVSSANGGTGNTSNASMTVVAPDVVSPPIVLKAFGTSSIPLNSTTSLSFTLNNPNGSATLTAVGFSDTLPVGLVVATPNGLTGSCGGGTITATAASNSVNLSGATLAASVSCAFSVNVTGTIAGTQNNTTGNVTSAEGGPGGTASGSISVVGPPSIAKAFGAPAIPAGSTTSLTFIITNPAGNAEELADVAFNDTLPGGMVVANPNALTNSCGGTPAAVAGSGSVSLAGAIVPLGGSCTVSINITAPAGNFTNTTGTVSSTNGGSGNTASANLIVASPPTMTKSFGAATMPLNGTSSLTFTVNNPNAFTAVTGVGFSDTFPAGLSVAVPNGLTGSCGGGTITAIAGSTSVSLSVATLAASATCSFSVNVTGISAGAQNNTTGNVTSVEGGTGGTASGSISVVAPPTIAKAFGAASIQPGGTTSLTFTITNPAANTVALTGIAFSDSLPSGITVANPNALANSCGGTATAVAGSGSVSLTGASMGLGSSCTVSVNITAPSAGNFTNTSSAVSSTNGGIGNSANASLTVIAPPAISKSFGAVSVQLNATTSLSFSINNPNATVSLDGVAFADSLPAGLVVATPNGLTGSCGGGTITAAAGSSSVTLSGATFSASSSCSFSVDITATTAGVKNNSVTVNSSNGGTGNTANASMTVVSPDVTSPPTIVKSFGSVSIPKNGTTSLSFTLNNPNVSAALTGVGFSDTLPAALSVATPNGLTGSCGGGTITATAGSNSVSLSGAALVAGDSCSFNVNVTGTIAGAQNNTTGNVTSVEGGTGGTASASIGVVAPPSIAKAFGATTMQPGGTTSLTFTITNPAANPVGLTGIAFSDSLPSGMTVANPNALTNSCGGTATAVAGSGSVSLTGASVGLGSSCTVSVNITAPAAGNFTNTTSAVSSTNGGSGNTASANLTVGNPGLNGDANGDGQVNVGDIFYLINFLFTGGPPPVNSADVNGDGNTNVADIFYLINFLFAGGPPPH